MDALKLKIKHFLKYFFLIFTVLLLASTVFTYSFSNNLPFFLKTYESSYNSEKTYYKTRFNKTNGEMNSNDYLFLMNAYVSFSDFYEIEDFFCLVFKNGDTQLYDQLLPYIRAYRYTCIDTIIAYYNLSDLERAKLFDPEVTEVFWWETEYSNFSAIQSDIFKKLELCSLYESFSSYNPFKNQYYLTLEKGIPTKNSSAENFSEEMYYLTKYNDFKIHLFPTFNYSFFSYHTIFYRGYQTSIALSYGNRPSDEIFKVVRNSFVSTFLDGTELFALSSTIESTYYYREPEEFSAYTRLVDYYYEGPSVESTSMDYFSLKNKNFMKFSVQRTEILKFSGEKQTLLTLLPTQATAHFVEMLNIFLSNPSIFENDSQYIPFKTKMDAIYNGNVTIEKLIFYCNETMNIFHEYSNLMDEHLKYG